MLDTLLENLIRAVINRDFEKAVEIASDPTFQSFMDGSTVITHHGIWSVEDFEGIDGAKQADLDDKKAALEHLSKSDLTDCDWDRLAICLQIVMQNK